MSDMSTPPVMPGAIPPPPPPPLPSVPPPAIVQMPSRRRGWLLGCLLVLGALAAMVLVVVVIVIAAVAIAGSSLTGRAGKSYGTEALVSGSDKQVIAVLDVAGTIDDEQARAFDLFCRQVEDEHHVKAIVLRVVSGGGEVSSCDQMYTMLKGLKARTGKKVVVSMGGVAASGGYYISCPADHIYAEPATITGSIGVIAIYPMIKGTLDKIGVKMMIVRSDHACGWKAAPNPFEEPTGYQMQDLRNALNTMHARFEGIVRAERGGKLNIEAARKIAPATQRAELNEFVPFDGRTYLGEEAKTVGLVDSVGYLKDAIDAAARLADLSQPKVVQYVRRVSLLREMGFGGQTSLIDVKALEQYQTPRLMMVWRLGE